MLLENLSQFYRTLIPTPLWFGFCSNYYDTGAVFAIIVTAGYLMIKGAVILASGRELFKALCTFIRDKVPIHVLYKIKILVFMWSFPALKQHPFHIICRHVHVLLTCMCSYSNLLTLYAVMYSRSMYMCVHCWLLMSLN